MSMDEVVHVVVLRPQGSGWDITPEGEAALDADQPLPRAVADSARELAITRSSDQMNGAASSL